MKKVIVAAIIFMLTLLFISALNVKTDCSATSKYF